MSYAGNTYREWCNGSVIPKILVTGGSGFIGRYVVENIKALGWIPIVFDRYLSNNICVDFFGDVRDFTSVSEAVSISDAVIHLAGVLGTAETVNEPSPAIDTNIYGSLNVFKACRNYQKPCTYISVGNYWMNNSYSITKYTAEKFALMYNKEHGTNIAVVRALNAYGPRQKIKPVRKIIPNFIIPALQGNELIVYGDGSQVMDMIYVKDVADVLVRAVSVNHGNYTEKFEAGTGVDTTVQEIAEMVIRLVGKGVIKNVPMRAGEPENSVVLGNPETLGPLYGGEIPVLLPLEYGLENTIRYYRGLYDK